MVVCGEIVDDALVNIDPDAPLYQVSIKSISSIFHLLLNAPGVSQNQYPHIAS